MYPALLKRKTLSLVNMWRPQYKMEVSLVSCYIPSLHPNVSVETLPVCFSLWLWMNHFSPCTCTKINGLVIKVIKVWTFEDAQVGSMFYIMKQPSLNGVRDCCKITHPLNEQVELAWGSFQGEEKTMWVSRLCMALSVYGHNNCIKANEQFDSCNSTLVPLSIQLTLRPRFPRASNQKITLGSTVSSTPRKKKLNICQ